MKLRELSSRKKGELGEVFLNLRSEDPNSGKYRFRRLWLVRPMPHSLSLDRKKGVI